MKRVYSTSTDITRLSGARTRVKPGDIVVINMDEGQHLFKAVPLIKNSHRCSGCCFDNRGCPRLVTSIARLRYPDGRSATTREICDEFLCTGSYNNLYRPRVIFKRLDDMLEDL